MANTEWIFANDNEGYDKWDEDVFQDGNVLHYRQYKYSMERYLKYVPPADVQRYAVGYQASYQELECYANGIQVNLVKAAGVDYPVLELMRRVKSFSPNDAGSVLITESWELVDQPIQVWTVGETGAGSWEDVV
jgi:hypothetical protein